MPGQFHAGRIDALQGVFLLRGQEDKIVRFHLNAIGLVLRNDGFIHGLCSCGGACATLPADNNNTTAWIHLTMPRQQFSSGLTAILTMAGAAIGLGNIWRFPYMMGSYGGSAFLLVYLLFVVLLAIPAMSGEWALGRRARGGTITAFALAFGPVRGRWVGYLLVTGMTFSTSYYLIVIGNVAYTAWFSTTSGFGPETNAEFLQNLGNRSLQYGISLGVLAGILWVAFKGLNDGIERVSKWFVPFFFVVILYLIFITLRLDGAVEKMAVFLQPDFSRLTLTSIFAALGQAAFSVGLGGTIMVVYGSYLREDTPLLKGACVTAFADTGAALLAALFIFPTILVFGIAPQAGPTLLFETLPHLFSLMEGGRLIGSFFLVALLMVAFLSGTPSPNRADPRLEPRCPNAAGFFRPCGYIQPQLPLDRP